MKIKVGDVLVNSWGYDQTNVDAYEVVRESAASVWLRKVAVESTGEAGGPMSGRVRPVKGAFVGEKVIRKARRAPWKPDGEETVSFEYGGCDLWDGSRSYYESWYA